MKRFEGAYPLAIASYNGGPHNMSYWLEGTGSEMPMDAFVEHIPFRETRDYVKKVSTGYARYLSLHAPEGTAGRAPRRRLEAITRTSSTSDAAHDLDHRWRR